MISEIDFIEMRNFLEDSLKEYKNNILSLNKYCNDDKSFLTDTYLFKQESEKNGVPNYLVIVFEDLPYPYPEKILEKIKQYVESKNLECEYIAWSTYKGYVNPSYI